MNSIISKKIEDFFKQYKHQTFKKSEILIRADENPQGVFCLTKGTVKEYTISASGEELIINVFKPISFFPMSWAINETPNNYYYEALEGLEIWRAPREEVVIFIKSNPDVLFDLMSRVYKGIDGILMKMAYLMSGEAYARVVIELLIAAKRFGNTTGQKTVELKVTEKEIASQTGMARETISREMKILKDKGLITFNKNKLVIKDLSLLELEIPN